MKGLFKSWFWNITSSPGIVQSPAPFGLLLRARIEWTEIQGLQEMPFRDRYFLGVIFLVISETLGDATLGVLCLVVGILFEVDSHPTSLPCFVILKSKKRVAQGGGERTQRSQRALFFVCVLVLGLVVCSAWAIWGRGK